MLVKLRVEIKQHLAVAEGSSCCLSPCSGFRLDECLWRSVDLEGLTHVGAALQRVLKTGVRRLRCPRAFVEELHFSDLRLV